MRDIESTMIVPAKRHWFNRRVIALLILLAAVISGSAIVTDLIAHRERNPATTSAAEPAR